MRRPIFRTISVLTPIRNCPSAKTLVRSGLFACGCRDVIFMLPQIISITNPCCQDHHCSWSREHLHSIEACVIEPEGAYRIWSTVPFLRPIRFGGKVVHYHHSTHTQRRQNHFYCRLSFRAA